MASTRAQRRARARDRREHESRNPGRFVPALAVMLDNPNRGKLHAARLDILGERDAATARTARKDYRPLTVSTRIDFDRIGRKRPATYSAYTV